MKEASLSLPADLTINLAAPQSQLGYTSRLLSAAYLPGVEWRDAAIRPDIRVNYLKSDEDKLQIDGDVINISDSNQSEDSLDFWNLLYSVARTHFLKNKLYPVHSAAIGQDEYILLVGHSGVGKSSLALSMMRDFDWNIFSGNKTLVSFGEDHKPTAVAGTKTITIEAADDEKWKGLIPEGTRYKNRIAFQPNRMTARESVPIKAIVLPNLNDGSQKSEELSPASALHTLYPYFLDVVDADTVMFGGKQTYESITPPQVREELAYNLANNLQIPTIKISGSKPYIAGVLNSI